MGEDIASWKSNNKEKAININVDNGEQDLNVDDDESTVPVPPVPMPAIFLYVFAMIATITISIPVVIVYICIQYGPDSVEAAWLGLIVMTCYCASSATLLCIPAYRPHLTPYENQGGEFDMQKAKVSIKGNCASLFTWIYFFINGKLLKDAKVPTYMVNLTYLLSAVSLVLNLVTLVYSLVILRQYCCSREQLGRVCSIQDEEDPLITNKV